MSYTLRYDKDVDCIMLAFDGRITMEVIKEAAPKVAALSEETSCSRILNDMSQTTIEISMMDVFGSPRVMDDSGVLRTTKRALVVPKDFTDAHFLETVTRNRGHDLMVFFDVDKAKEWLLQD